MPLYVPVHKYLVRKGVSVILPAPHTLLLSLLPGDIVRGHSKLPQCTRMGPKAPISGLSMNIFPVSRVTDYSDQLIYFVLIAACENESHPFL